MNSSANASNFLCNEQSSKRILIFFENRREKEGELVSENLREHFSLPQHKHFVRRDLERARQSANPDFL